MIAGSPFHTNKIAQFSHMCSIYKRCCKSVNTSRHGNNPQHYNGHVHSFDLNNRKFLFNTALLGERNPTYSSRHSEYWKENQCSTN